MLPFEYDETIIGQYGKSSDGQKPAFKDEEDVPEDSRCATFCAAVGHIENERWAGVPFLLKAGKGISQFIANSNIRMLITQLTRPTPQLSTNPSPK